MNGAQQPQGISINLGEYIEQKAAGVSRIVKVNGAVYYSRKAFDPVSGKPIPQLVPMDRDQLVAAIAEHEKALDGMRATLADIDGAQEVLAAAKT